MADIEELTPGVQVIYVPPHAGGRLDHPNSEEGFVTAAERVGSVDVAWCRFWSRIAPGLRTRGVSEACAAGRLVVKKTRPQAVVKHWLKIIREEENGNS